MHGYYPILTGSVAASFTKCDYKMTWSAHNPLPTPGKCDMWPKSSWNGYGQQNSQEGRIYKVSKVRHENPDKSMSIGPTPQIVERPSLNKEVLSLVPSPGLYTETPIQALQDSLPDTRISDPGLGEFNPATSKQDWRGILAVKEPLGQEFRAGLCPEKAGDKGVSIGPAQAPVIYTSTPAGSQLEPSPSKSREWQLESISQALRETADRQKGAKDESMPTQSIETREQSQVNFVWPSSQKGKQRDSNISLSTILELEEDSEE